MSGAPTLLLSGTVREQTARQRDHQDAIEKPESSYRDASLRLIHLTVGAILCFQGPPYSTFYESAVSLVYYAAASVSACQHTLA